MNRYYVLDIGSFNGNEMLGKSKAEVLKQYIKENYPPNTKTKRVSGEGYADICIEGVYERTYYLIIYKGEQE